MVPSYKKICIAILKNDYKLKTLGYSFIQTERYVSLKREEMKNKKQKLLSIEKEHLLDIQKEIKCLYLTIKDFSYDWVETDLALKKLSSLNNRKERVQNKIKRLETL